MWASLFSYNYNDISIVIVILLLGYCEILTCIEFVKTPIEVIFHFWLMHVIEHLLGGEKIDLCVLRDNLN